MRGPCGAHKTEVCSCGNTLSTCRCLDSGSKLRINHRVCRCKKPGNLRQMRHRRFSRSTLYGNVRKTWEDLDNDQHADEVYSRKIRAHRHHERQKRLGGRVIYDM